MRFVAALFASLALASTAYAADNGMYLCRSPVVANDYWTDLTTAGGTGLQFTDAIVASIAAKNGCTFAASGNLKPINYVAGMLEMTDGHFKGWATPQSYIIYINRPATAKNSN
jgi:hypothetical protein